MSSTTIEFVALIERFFENGEKSGWTYIEIPSDYASVLKPGNRKSFRVKGFLDKHKISQTAVMPMGGGKFILPINATMRKGTGKRHGSTIKVKITVDSSEITIDKDLLECLEDDTKARDVFMKYTPTHQGYFSKWIGSAKTSTTKAKRIALTLDALNRGLDFGEMLRENKKGNR